MSSGGAGPRSVGRAILEEILPCLPPTLRLAISRVPADVIARTHEIRLNRGRPVTLVAGGDEFPLDECVFGEREAVATIQLMSDGSLYVLEEELRQGYITLRGGHRVGLAGRAVLEGGRIKLLKDISSFCIRVSHEVLGAADRVMPHIIRPPARLFHTLVISPPRCGKTTLLRDIVRQASDGVPSLGFRGVRVAVADERSEIAACYAGVPQNTVGSRTDVLDACPKAEGMIMLVRSMSPDVVATDEIGREEDARAVREVMNAGVSVVATAHGDCVEDVARRPALGGLFEEGCFERVVLLSQRNGPGTLEAVLDARTGRALAGGEKRRARSSAGPGAVAIDGGDVA